MGFQDLRYKKKAAAIQKHDQAAAVKQRMNYRNLRSVYTIVLYESSPAEFHKFPGNYIHRFRQTSDTGLEMDLLEEYIFVPLDILKEIVQNRKKISNELEAWLAFFCMDEPEWILKLSETYPLFREMYEEIYAMCQDLEGVMQMYSKELQELDSNTVQYMIDQMQEAINQKEAQLSEKDKELKAQASQLSQKDKELKAQVSQLNQKVKQLGEKDKEIAAQANLLNEKDDQLSQKDNLIAELQRQLQEMKKTSD